MPVSTKRLGGVGGLLPKGVYRVVIESVEEKQGPSGHPYLNFRLRPYVNGQKQGQAIWDKISLSPDARFRVENFLDALGVEDSDDEIQNSWFVGKSYWASLSSREYQGQWSNEVKQYLTEEAAEQLLAKQADEFGSSEAVTVPTQRSTRPVPPPAATKNKSRVTAEAQEETPF